MSVSRSAARAQESVWPLAVTALTAIAVAAFLTAMLASAAPATGEPAPTFDAVGSDGKTYRLADYKGSTVVLEWTNHLCPYTEKHYDSGNMQPLQKEAAADGIVWLSVISSAPGLQGYVTAKEANALTETRDAAPAAVLLDPEGTVGRLYAAATTPQMFIIDADGRLVYQGAIDDEPSTWGADPLKAKNYVRLALAEMADGKSVSTPSTRPYGCSVKYAR